MKNIVKHSAKIMLGWIPLKHVESLIQRLIYAVVNSMSADKALCFLFRLDNMLYSLEGKKAIEYGGGVHTKHRHLRYHDFFVGRIRKGERVLDIGCGNGAVAFDIAEHAHASVVGIDVNPDNISYARKHFSHPLVEYRLGDVFQELPPGPFDVIILSNVLEHLKDRIDFLQQVQKTVRPSRVLIRAPLFERDWRVPLKQELGIEWRLDPTHETEYTPESFAEELTSAGLNITWQEVRWGEIWAEAIKTV